MMFSPSVEELPLHYLRLLLSLAGGLVAAGMVSAAPFAYVPNENSGSVSIIDTATDKVVGELRTGGKPRGIAVSPDGARLYLSDRASNSLLVVDLARREVEKRIPLGQSPEGISLSRDGRWLAAAIEEADSVVLID